MPHEASDPNTGKRKPVSVRLNGLDPPLGYKRKMAVIKHLKAVGEHPCLTGTDADTTKTEGSAESVLSSGSVDGTADTAEIGLISKENGSEAACETPLTLVRATANTVLTKSCKKETE